MGTDGGEDEGDRLLSIAGALIAVAVVGSLAVIVLAGANAPAGEPEPPDANWTVMPVNETHVRIEHAGGDPVRPSDLVVSVGGKIRQVTWSAERLVTEGDYVIVRAPSERNIRVFWEPNTATRALLYPE